MRLVIVMLVLGACSSPTTEPPPRKDVPPATEHRKCLPVVAKECGCVYSCGSGVEASDHWNVTHSNWKPTTLHARIEPWCVAGRCTDVFAAEIVCAGICAPKPADATCHFDASSACVGAN